MSKPQLLKPYAITAPCQVCRCSYCGHALELGQHGYMDSSSYEVFCTRRCAAAAVWIPGSEFLMLKGGADYMKIPAPLSNYQMARFEDLKQRVQVQGETLTNKEQRELNTYEAICRARWEAGKDFQA